MSGIGDANALFRDRARQRKREGKEKKIEIVKVIEGNRRVGETNDTRIDKITVIERRDKIISDYL